jgi:SEC-C motif
VSQEPQTTSVLDVRQLTRIEATHRGFLYQHLFAAGCLLQGAPAGIEAVIVEHDEDLELIAGGRHIYAQIKTRSEKLYEADLGGFFERAKQLAEAHAAGRPGTAEIWLITNAPLSSGLAARLQAEKIGIWSPYSVTRVEPLFPPAHADVNASFAWCAGLASQIALTRLSPDTLVWKLAAVVAYRSAGLEGGHIIRASELSGLYELFAAQLHHFPESPAVYRPQEHEPALDGEDRIVLVASLSGAGKTAWASYSALHSGATIVYFDGAGMPDAAVAGALMREAIAQISAKAGMAGRDLIQPGSSGLEGLRAVDVMATNASVRPIIVFDNVHTLLAQTVKTVVGAMSLSRWVLLGQPSPNTVELETLLATAAVRFDGWSVLTIAAEFESAGVPVDPATAERVRNLTGGMPRFATNAATLASKFYGGDASAFCDAVESSANTTRTAQEVILDATFKHLTSEARAAAALLSIARFALSEAECLDFLSINEILKSKARAAKAVAELGDWGIVQRLLSGALVTHDAFIVLSAALFEELSSGERMNAMKKLASIVEKSVAPGQVSRLMVYCRLLPRIGRADALADIASSIGEHIHEQGRSEDLRLVLEDVLTSPEVSPEDRFMVADTLALWEFHQTDKSGFFRLVGMMDQLARDYKLGGDCGARLLLKQMMEAALEGDITALRSRAEKAMEAAVSPVVRRIVKYNMAVSFYMAERPEDTLPITDELIEEYFETLGLTEEMVYARSPKALADDLGDDPYTMDELKRLGDVLDLRARALNELGIKSGLCRLHAMKFYQIAHMPLSLMKVGQDVVDECLSILNDPPEARRVIETLLLPIVQEYRLVDYVVPVRGQYAVVLAYCGEIDDGRRLISDLKRFTVSEERSLELEAQAKLIERIALRERRSSRLTPPSKSLKVGRNDPCHCGSGKKYKKCHGA